MRGYGSFGNSPAHRTEQSICAKYAEQLVVGSQFKYKDYLCTVDEVSRNLIRFTGKRVEKSCPVVKRMTLNAESFNDAVEDKRVKLLSTAK